MWLLLKNLIGIELLTCHRWQCLILGSLLFQVTYESIRCLCRTNHPRLTVHHICRELGRITLICESERFSSCQWLLFLLILLTHSFCPLYMPAEYAKSAWRISVTHFSLHHISFWWNTWQDKKRTKYDKLLRALDLHPVLVHVRNQVLTVTAETVSILCACKYILVSVEALYWCKRVSMGRRMWWVSCCDAALMWTRTIWWGACFSHWK
jgi:hypothetical protein